MMGVGRLAKVHRTDRNLKVLGLAPWNDRSIAAGMSPAIAIVRWHSESHQAPGRELAARLLRVRVDRRVPSRGALSFPGGPGVAASNFTCKLRRFC